MSIKKDVADYISANSDKPIYVVYNELKTKKRLTNAERIVYTYLKINKNKLGIK